MSALDRQLAQLGRAMNATPAEVAALTALALDIAPAPTRCPSCGGVMGDGDRVSFGICSPCRRARRAR